MNDKVRKALLGQMKSHYKYSLKKCLDALRNHRRETKLLEDIKQQLK